MKARKKKKKSNRGRPSTVKIDAHLLETIMSYGATCLDCANEFDCSEDTIVRFIKSKWGMNYAEFSKKRQGKVRIKLRQKMLQLALEKGNTALLIWCSKNMLGWSDSPEISKEPEGFVFVDE